MSSTTGERTGSIQFNGLSIVSTDHVLVGTDLPSSIPSYRIDVKELDQLGIVLTTANSKGIINATIGGTDHQISILGLPADRVVDHPQLKRSKVVQNIRRNETFTVEVDGNAVTFEVSAL